MGFLAVSLHGTGNAGSLMAAGPIVAAIRVILLLPEKCNQEMQDFVETAEDSPGSSSGPLGHVSGFAARGVTEEGRGFHPGLPNDPAVFLAVGQDQIARPRYPD